MATPGWAAPGPQQNGQQRPPQRRKGNPIITKYAPPPGYKGPGWQPPYLQQIQAQGQYSQPQPPYHGQPAPYQPHQSPYVQPGAYPQPQPPYQAQGQQSYQAPQSYPQPPYGQQWPQPPPQQSPYAPAPPAPPAYQAGQQHSHNASPATPQWSPQQNGHQWPPPQANAYQQSWPGQQPNTAYPQASQTQPPSQYPAHHGQYVPYPNAPASGPPVPYGPGSHHAYHNSQVGDGAQQPQQPPAQGYGASNGAPNGAHGADQSRWQYGGHQGVEVDQGPTIPDVDEGPPPRKMPSKEPLVYGPDDDHHFWDFENSMGALWPKSTDPVSQRTSIGIAVWRPAAQVTRALAVPYEAAELQAEEPAKPTLDNSVSKYFASYNAYEAHLDVRQTDYWDEIEHYDEFKVIKDDHDTIPLHEVIELCRRGEDFLADRRRETRETSRDENDGWDVMDTLVEHLDKDGDRAANAVAIAETSQPEPRPANGEAGSPQSSRQAPDGHASGRNDQQEDILARLGVTGAPKPHSGSSYPKVHTSHDDLPRRGDFPPPPPPPIPHVRSPDPWTTDGADRRKRSHSVASHGSHRTLAGSDFDMDGAKLTNRAQEAPSERERHSPEETRHSPVARKRSFVRNHEHRSPSNDRDGGRQPDDGGRRKRPKHNNPYGRR